MKLLIVDDSAMIRRAIATAYRRTTFTEIQTAADGLLALTVFKQFLPEVVTLDITMPHMDGLSALTQMLAVKPETQVLVISALADHHTAIESLSRGAEQFICKPFSPEDLKEALDDLMTSKSARKSRANRRPTETTRQMSPPPRDASVRVTLPVAPSSSLPPTQVPDRPSPEAYPSGYVDPPKVDTGQRPLKIVPLVPPQSRRTPPTV